MELNYGQFLKVPRLRGSSRGVMSVLDESESDRGRVLYSAAWRRLQRKTQVFPLEENAAIRSRLTHSLEVAHVGRFLATKFLSRVNQEGLRRAFGIDDEGDLAIPNVVETACLLHDIGNPPFGHFGEAAIANWFRSGLPGFSKHLGREIAEVSELGIDFERFDGNPQGFRIITRLSGIDGFGMNLMPAQIAATVKYPVISSEVDVTASPNPLRKKAGVFLEDAERWTDVCVSLGMEVGTRFPLAYLMEAADDISYCLSDIEDGIEKGYLTHKMFVEDVRGRVAGNKRVSDLVDDAIAFAAKNAASVEPTVSFRTKLIRFLVDELSGAYFTNHQKIFDGGCLGLTEEAPDAGCLLDGIRGTVKTLLYGKRLSHELELTGLAAIKGILRAYECLLSLSHERMAELASGVGKMKGLEEEVKLFSLLPEKHVGCYRSARNSQSETQEWISRVHLIKDFVSGMTDVFALKTYQMLSGIRM